MIIHGKILTGNQWCFDHLNMSDKINWEHPQEKPWFWPLFIWEKNRFRKKNHCFYHGKTMASRTMSIGISKNPPLLPSESKPKAFSKSSSGLGVSLVNIPHMEKTYQPSIYLVGGWGTPLKNMSSSVGIIIPNIWKNGSKPQTSHGTHFMPYCIQQKNILIIHI